MAGRIIYLFTPMSEQHPNRIREIRKKKGLRANALADKLNVSAMQLSYWERGIRGLTIDNAERIAAALGVDTADILPATATTLALTDAERRHLENYRALDAVARRTVEGVAENLIEWRGFPRPDGNAATPPSPKNRDVGTT